MEQTKKRNGFSSGIGFILAAAGSAIGLGNLWSFPYKTSANGGAAFVITYMISAIIIGVIVMVSEIYIGKRAQANPITSYKKTHKNLGWLGIFAIIIPTLIICYYSILGGYTIKYTVNSFGDNTNVISSFTADKFQVVLFTLIFILIAVLVVMGGVKSGIENASKILMPVLFFILVALAIYSLTLGEGVKEGLSFYLKPNFKELGFKGILAAMSQAFFSLSLGMGIMVSYGSYAGENINVGKSIAMIVIFDTMVALLAGLTIFPAVFNYKATTGQELTTSGIMLLFESMPLIFAKMGLLGKFISVFFFGMVVIAALTSVISLLEVATQFIIQKFKIKRKFAILVVALITFVLSIPISISLGFALNGSSSMQIFGRDWLTFLDDVTNVVLMPLGALGACLAIGWFTFKGNNKNELLNPAFLNKALESDGLNLGWFGKVFAVMVKYVTPLLIIIVEVFGVVEFIFPSNKGGNFDENGLGVVLTAYAICAVCILVYFIFFKNSETGVNADELELEKK